jgi:hypothetical protein
MKRKLYRLYREIGEKYPESKIVFGTEGGVPREKFLRMFIPSFPRVLKGRTLDVGCEDGHFRYLFHEYVGPDVSAHKLRQLNDSQSVVRDGILD